jgi:hypothetical protein
LISGCISLKKSYIFVAMKNITTYLILILFSATLIDCSGNHDEEPSPKYNFSEHEVSPTELSNLEKRTSYLSVYSEIYSNTEKRTHSLTVTVSIRNTSTDKNIYLAKADYYDTHGDLITSYVTNPIKVVPLETIEIVIDKSQNHGGTGGNFIFEWAKDSTTTDPIF